MTYKLQHENELPDHIKGRSCFSGLEQERNFIKKEQYNSRIITFYASKHIILLKAVRRCNATI